MDMINLKEEDFVAKGNERACYIHPADKNKAVKISYEQDLGRSKQSDLEIAYYKELLKKRDMSWKHLPKYYGEIETDKGTGFIIELIRDYDGEISKSFAYYIDKDGVDKYKQELKEYKEYFLKYHIIFNYGMMPKNILLRKENQNSSHLVLIDGLGDVTYFTFPNKIRWLLWMRPRKSVCLLIGDGFFGGHNFT